MKTLKITTVTVIIIAMLLAGCGPVRQAGAVVQELLADRSTEVAAQNVSNDVLAPTAMPVVRVNDTTSNAPSQDLARAPVAANGALAALQTTFEDVYQQVNPSVVNIQVEASLGGSSSRFSQGVTQSLGSGFVWDTQGHIVTNNHVVEGATRVLVTFSDDTTVPADLVGADPQSDLAVIKVDPTKVDLRPVVMADSNQVKVGQIAIAIGNPYGLSGTMTQGIISARSRSLPVSSGSTSSMSGTYTIPDIIQTDAAINPGNSGGVLLDVQGQVIGVPTAIRSSADSNSGIGFIVPANIVSRVVPVLIKDGKYDHPRLGITGTTLTSDLAESIGLKADQRGVVVIDVTSGGPASRAGVRGSTARTVNGQQVPSGGDVIIGIDNQTVRNFEDLSTYLFYNTEVGQTVDLHVLRDGRETTLKVTLATLSLSQE